MEQNINNKNTNTAESTGILKKFKNTTYSILFELPFNNYHTLYKTGKIQQMDIDQRKQMLYMENHAKLKIMFFCKLINLRPTILDDEDYIEFNNLLKISKREKGATIIGFFGLNSWTFYMVSIKKQKFFAKFLGFNFILIGMLYYSSFKLQKFYERMYVKYDKEIVNQEMDEKMKIVFRKE
jgi:hypothetical protein